ncbi:MAG: zinc ribbon domain-containing protein [Arcobacteraceae bacterium]|jgi:RNA polymerase subunit RPABC4/transcription elongation factor Spt4|nr:zinc ribbon domain-containing protein [Arcobacteraceae bacterium]
MPICSKCNTQINKESKFCPQCGNPVDLDNNTTKKNDKLVPCKKCKQEVSLGIKECPYCKEKYPTATLKATIMTFGTLFIAIWIIFSLFDNNQQNERKITNTAESYNITQHLMTLSVSDFEYTFKDKPAVSISIGESNNDFISITLHRNNIYEGFTTTSNNDISITATWDKLTFFQNHLSRVSFTIEKMDSLNKEAIISLNATLHTNTENHKELNISTKTTIKDKNFDNLLLNRM